MNQNKYIQNYFNKFFINDKVEPLSKNEVYNIILSDMLQQTNEMLEWKNLPETMEPWILNLQLQTNGYAIIAEDKKKIYSFIGGLGGTPDVYYLPTIATVANPALQLSKTYTLDKDAILIRNDRFCEGLLPWSKLYASQIAEAFMTLRIGLINSRTEYVLTASSDVDVEGIRQFFKNLEEGVHLGHIVNDTFLDKDSIDTKPYSSGAINSVRSAVETIQYLYSSWCRGVGISSTFNSKREYVTDTQTTQPEESIVNRSLQMLECAKEGAEKVNKMFNLNISVDFGSIWKDRQKKNELEEKIIKEEINNDDEPKEKGGEEDAIN